MEINFTFFASARKVNKETRKPILFVCNNFIIRFLNPCIKKEFVINEVNKTQKFTLFEQSEFVNFSFENNINRTLFYQQGSFLLVRFLWLPKENEHLYN